MIPELPPTNDLEQRDHPLKASDNRPALRPPQFTLATMFWVMSGCGLLLAAMLAVGPLGAFALLLLVLAIVAHIAGNSLGTQLRQIGDAHDSHDAPARPRRRTVAQHEFAPETQLCRRTSISRTMIAFTIAGAVLLGVMGSAALFWLTWGQVNLPTAIVAVASSCVLGGFVGFMCSSFAQVAGGAWWQARRGVK